MMKNEVEIKDRQEGLNHLFTEITGIEEEVRLAHLKVEADTGIFLVLMSETSRLHYNNNNILLFKNKFAKCNNVSLFSVYDIKEQKNF